MTKIKHLRERMREEYNNRNLLEALAIADALIAEHQNCQSGNIARADDLFNLAIIYDELDQLEEAAGLYKESAMHICKCDLRHMWVIAPFMDLSEDEWLALALRINNLAAVLARMENLEEAKHYFWLVKAIYARFKHPNLADTVYNIGNLAVAANDNEEALSLHVSALTMRNKEDKSPEDIMHSLHSIAFIYESKGEYQKAIPYAETALWHAVGAAYTSSCIYLAKLYEICEEPEKALDLYDQVLGEMTQTGYRRCDYLTILSRRANLVYKTGDTKGAVELYAEILDIYDSLTGLDLNDLDSQFYADCLKTMAELNNVLNETARAKDYMLKSIITRKASGGELIEDICFLIRLYLKDDTYDKAMDMLIYALVSIENPYEPGTEKIVDAILEAFTIAENTDKLLAAVKETNNEQKILSILDMWQQQLL